MASDIADLLQLLRQPRVFSYVAVNDPSSHALTNLAVCVSSAKELVSAANVLVNTRKMTIDDRTSNVMDFTDQRRNEISTWIPKPSLSEEMEYVGSDRPSDSVITGSTFDREHVNIQTLLKFAMLAYRAQKYEEAMVLLQKFKARSEARYGPMFENRDEMLAILVTTLCRLKEWESAEEIVCMDFDGREEAVKTLVWCYCEDGRWIDAEHILHETIDVGTASDTETNEILAEIYFGKGEYDKAIKSCDRILKTVGDDHVQFYVTLSLLAQIYEAKGDSIEAKLHRDLLPAGIEGIPQLESLLIDSMSRHQQTVSYVARSSSR